MQELDIIKTMHAQAQTEFAKANGLTVEQVEQLTLQRQIAGLCEVCAKCIKARADDRICYHGKSCFECPAYDTRANQPPTEYRVYQLENWKNLND